jgi:hypothetical protein
VMDFRIERLHREAAKKKKKRCRSPAACRSLRCSRATSSLAPRSN